MKLPSTYAKLGIVKEMVINYKGFDYIHTWPRTGGNKRILLASSNGKSLLILKPRKTAYKPTNREMASEDVTKALKVLTQFRGRPGAWVSRINVPNYKLAKFGTVTSIVYYAEKGAKESAYIHEFKHRNTARINYSSVAKDGKDPAIVQVSGEYLKVTKRGIEG